MPDMALVYAQYTLLEILEAYLERNKKKTLSERNQNNNLN